jgi:hypothetical protein
VEEEKTPAASALSAHYEALVDVLFVQNAHIVERYERMLERYEAIVSRRDEQDEEDHKARQEFNKLKRGMMLDAFKMLRDVLPQIIDIVGGVKVPTGAKAVDSLTLFLVTLTPEQAEEIFGDFDSATGVCDGSGILTAAQVAIVTAAKMNGTPPIFGGEHAITDFQMVKFRELLTTEQMLQFAMLIANKGA